MQLSCLPCCYYRYEAKKHRQHKKLFSIPRRRLWREKRKARRISAAVKPKELWRTRTTRKFLCGELLSPLSRGRMNICALAMAKNDNDDDDDDDEKGVRYATSTNASAPKMDDEDDVIKFDPLEFIPHFSYAWVVLGFLLPSVVFSLPIVQEQDDGGVSLLYQTRLCSEVAKLAYLSYALGKRNFTLSIGNQPQNDVLSGAAFGIGTSLAARVAEQTLTPALVESNSSVVTTSTPAVLAIVLSSTVLAPITEEIFFRGVVLECGSDLFRNPDEQANTRAVFSLAAANVFAAGIFSLAHFNFSIPALLNLFICGIGFGLAFLSSERRNVTVPIIAHSVYNLSVLIESYSNGVLLVQ